MAEPPGTLRLVDLASGDVRWSLPVPAGARPLFELAAGDSAVLDGSATVVLTLPSGRVEVRELRTGAVVRSTELPPRGAGSGGWHGEIVGGLFLAYGDRSVTAYGLPGLDRRWSVPIDHHQEYGLSDCGADLLCSFRQQGGVRVWDARTDGTRWADRRWTQVWPADDVLLAVGMAGSPGESLYVLDPTTWRSRILAVLPEISGDCGHAGETLYCRRLDASVGVWRLPD